MKKLFSLCIAILCGMVSISAKTLYCKMEHGWWTADGAAIAAHAWNSTDNTNNGGWPGVRMTHPENDNTVWTIDVDNKFDKVIFVRVNSTGDIKDWGAKTTDLIIPTDEKNLFTITSSTAVWGDPGCDGEWSVYVAPAEPIKDVYTVAGAKAILGSEWNPADTNNDMTEQEDGTYKLEKTDVLLNAGDYNYKVVVNRAWEPKLMEDQTLSIEKAGYHTLTFTYNASTKAVGAIATLTKEAEVDPVIQIKGQFDNEDATKWIVEDLVLAADKKTATTTLTLTARTIEMGILLDGNWNSNGKEIKPSSNTITLTETGEGNIKLYAPEDGEYTFTYTLESKTLVVTFPSSTATDLIGADTNNAAVKLIRDGQVLIVRDGVTYNMVGQIVR